MSTGPHRTNRYNLVCSRTQESGDAFRDPSTTHGSGPATATGPSRQAHYKRTSALIASTAPALVELRAQLVSPGNCELPTVPCNPHMERPGATNASVPMHERHMLHGRTPRRSCGSPGHDVPLQRKRRWDDRTWDSAGRYVVPGMTCTHNSMPRRVSDHFALLAGYKARGRSYGPENSTLFGATCEPYQPQLVHSTYLTSMVKGSTTGNIIWVTRAVT